MGDHLAETVELFMGEVVTEDLGRQFLNVRHQRRGQFSAVAGEERFHVGADLLDKKRILEVLERDLADLGGDLFRLEQMLRDQDAQFMAEPFFLPRDHSLRPIPFFFIGTEQHPDGDGIGKIADRGGGQDRNQIFAEETSGGEPCGQIFPGGSFRDDQQDDHKSQDDAAGGLAGAVGGLDPVRFFLFGNLFHG